MLQSFLVYGLFSLSLFVLGKNAEARENFNGNMGLKPSFWTWETMVILFLFSFISGVRWNVGVDHLRYLENYKKVINGGEFKENGIEFVFEYITKLFADLNIHFSFYFGFWALMQIIFIYYTLKDERYLWPFIGIVIILGPYYLSWMNGIRQMFAACMFVYAVQFIKNRRLAPYIITVFLASLIHKSAILLVFLYFIPQYDYFKNRYINLALCVVTVIIGLNPYWLQATNFIEYAVVSVGYEGYAVRIDEWIDGKRVMEFGPRRVGILLLNVLVIWYAPILKEIFKGTNFPIFFNFTFVGVLLHNLFANAGHIFLRPVGYFTIFLLLTTSYLLYYLKKKTPKGLSIEFVFVFLIAISYTFASIMLEFGKGDLDTTNYKFFWDYIQ